MKEVPLGRDWPDVEYNEFDPRSIRERARAMIAFILLAGIALVNATAATYGFLRDDWEALHSTAYASSAVLWVVLGWYFFRTGLEHFDDLGSS